MSVEGWKEVKLNDVIEINKNSYSARDNWDYINYLDTGNITENRIDSIQYLDPKTDKIPSRAKRKVNANDIIYSTVRPNQRHYGIIRHPFKNMLVSTGFAVINGKDELADNGFLYWYLTQDNIVELLHTIGEHSTSAYPSIKPSDIEGLDIMLPPLKEQKAIAVTLSAFDDAIDINNQINKTLEEMAQAIFKSWFVDFEPFQDGEFEDSELGRIPKGWRVGTIKDFTLEMKNGGTPSRKNKSYWASNDVAWLKTGEINNAPIIKTEEYISFEGLNNSSAKMLPNNAVVLAMYGATAGKVGLLRIKSSTNQACCGMICDSENKSIFLYLSLLENQQYVESLAVGAAQQNLSKETISKLSIIIPPDDILEAAPFEDLYDSIENLMRQNETLVAIRDSLLPRLMSGEIRVPVQEVN